MNKTLPTYLNIFYKQEIQSKFVQSFDAWLKTLIYTLKEFRSIQKSSCYQLSCDNAPPLSPRFFNTAERSWNAS